MRVLRNNEDTLMTVLETFLHDPAVDMVKKVGPNIETKTTPQVRKSAWIDFDIVRSSGANGWAEKNGCQGSRHS